MVPTHHFAIDGVSEELLAAGDDGACQAERGGRLVEELEGPVVDADGVHLQEQLRPRRGRAQDLRHGDSQVALFLLHHPILVALVLFKATFCLLVILPTYVYSSQF